MVGDLSNTPLCHCICSWPYEDISSLEFFFRTVLLQAICCLDKEIDIPELGLKCLSSRGESYGNKLRGEHILRAFVLGL
jgi:hypothetical protein